MLLNQVEAFIEVARTRTVSRAADALSVTQPALTARLQRLEEDLGSKLFLRTPRGMTLLPAGQVFLAHARSILAAVARAVDATRAANELPPGRAGA